MKTARYVLAAFYLLQTIVICFTCYFAVKAAQIPMQQDPNNDSFGEGIALGLGDILQPVEVALVGAFFLFFFICSLVTSVLLLRQKNFVTTFAFAGSATWAALISTLITLLRLDVSWGLLACAEVLLGVATMLVVRVSIRNQRRLVMSHA